MTPKLIRIVAAACLAASLLPAQEVREVIVRQKADKAKSSSKASSISAKKMKAIIEELSSGELSSAERAKLKKTLMKMLGDVSGKPTSITFDAPAKRDAVAEAKPTGIRWHVAEGKEGKEGKKDGKVKATYAWVEDVESAHDHGHGHEKGEHGEEHSNKAEYGAKRDAIIAELNKSLSRGHGAGGGVGGLHEAHGVERKARAIAGLPRPDGEHDAIAFVRKSKDGDGKTIRWLKTSKQDQGKAKKAKSGDLATRAKQLRVRLDKPEGAAGGLAYVFDTEQEPVGKSVRLLMAQKAYEKAKKAYAEAKKAHGKAATVEGRYGFVELDDVTESHGDKGTIRYVRTRDAKQDPKKVKVKAKAKGENVFESLLENGEPIQLKLGSEVIEYLPQVNGEDVRIFLRGKDGKLKASRKKSDGFTFETKTDEKGRFEVESFMFDEGGAQGSFTFRKPKSAKQTKNTWKFEEGAKGEWNAPKAKKPGKQAKGSFFFGTRSDASKDDSGERDVLLKLKSKGDQEGFWVVDGKDSKRAGAWVTHIPSIEKDVLLKLLHSDGDDREIRTVLKMIDGKDSSAKGTKHDGLLFGVHAPHAHGHDVEVVVEEREAEEEEEETEEGGNDEVLEMIEEMRVEMRELRSMMQEIRNSLRSNRASSNSARRVRTGRQLPPAVRNEETAKVRVRRSETR